MGSTKVSTSLVEPRSAKRVGPADFSSAQTLAPIIFGWKIYWFEEPPLPTPSE
jgi:hypothetical protein